VIGGVVRRAYQRICVAVVEDEDVKMKMIEYPVLSIYVLW